LIPQDFDNPNHDSSRRFPWEFSAGPKFVANLTQEEGVKRLGMFVVEPSEFRSAPHVCHNDARGGRICLAGNSLREFLVLNFEFLVQIQNQEFKT
jgi:hypothetical protein